MCVYPYRNTGLPEDRQDTGKEERKSSLTGFKQELSRVGKIPEAEGETPPCIWHRAELIPPAEQTSP